MARPEKWTTPPPPPSQVPPPREGRHDLNDNKNGGSSDGTAVAVQQSSLLHPRVAVVLGVSEGWHPPLFACRLLSTGPAVWWGFPIALRLLVHFHLLVTAGMSGGQPSSDGMMWFRADDKAFDRRLRLMETMLAIIWVRCGIEDRRTLGVFVGDDIANSLECL